MVVTLTLDVHVNGGSVTATVFEDTDQDGTAEAQQSKTFTVSGSSVTKRYSDLSGGTGNDYWVQFSLDAGIGSTPDINSASLDSNPDQAGLLITDSTLNGGSISVEVFEDTDGDGSAENIEIVDLAGGSSEENPLYAIAGDGGNDFWIRPVLDAAITDSPTLNTVQVVTEIITAQAATVQISGQNGSISPGGSSIGADAGSASSVAPNASLAAGGASIQAQPVVLSAAGQDAGVSPGAVSITADEATLQITAQNAGRVFDSTTLSGTVTLNGSAVEGATIYCIDDTNESIAEVTTTDQNGDYRVRVDTGDLYHMVVQYEDSQGNQYNDESKPFLAT